MTYVSEFILILVSDLYVFRSPIGVTEFMLIQRYLIRYWYLYLSHISRRCLQNLYLLYGVYTCSEVPIGITEITERIHVFWILYMYYKTYTCISDLTCILRNLYWSYGTYICIQDLFLSYRSYTCATELILVFRILFFCKGTRRYDKSEQIRIISHTRSDQTSTDTDLSLL